MTTAGTSSADPAALRVYVRVTREVDQELLSLARGRLRSALADFRTGCPDAARLIPEFDLLVEQLALRGLRLSDPTDRVAADFEAAGGGPDLIGVLRPQVTGDLGDLSRSSSGSRHRVSHQPGRAPKRRLTAKRCGDVIPGPCGQESGHDL